MFSRTSNKEMIVHGNRYFLSGLSVNCVIFGFINGTLRVLLSKYDKLSKWRLPGGLVAQNENLEQVAYKVLEQRTGLTDVYLCQFHTFGDVKRRNIDELKGFSELYDYDFSEKSWLMQRFVSVVYYAFVDVSLVEISTEGEDLKWFELEEIPPLAMDHVDIINQALDNVRRQAGLVPLAKYLLPEKFTLPELQQIYETVQGQKLDRRNFRRKVLASGILKKLEEKRSAGAHKSPDLYMLETYLNDNSPMLLR